MSAQFMLGLELSRRFFEEAVRPILAGSFPQLTYSAARVGSGSEVLGFDTERSPDHEWGPRLQLFLSEDDMSTSAESVTEALSERLPKEFLGWSTHFGPKDSAIRAMEPTTGPVRHRVEVTSVSAWSVDGLGFDALGGVTVFDWLATPGQRLAEAVGGAVFHDGLRELTALRQRLQWYPDDVWRFVLAGQWLRVAQEEAFPGRCAEVGDDVGARVVTARIVRDLMRLCLLTGRRYVPYSKWLGSAFDTLPVAGDLRPVLHRALTALTWRECERHLAFAYEMVGEQHNRLALTPALDVATRNYYDRPYRVIDGGRFSDALLQGITDARMRALPPVGNVDSFIDSTDVLSEPLRARAAAGALLTSVR